MWKKITKKMKSETLKKGIYNLKHGNYTYPITLQLLKDGRKNKVLNSFKNTKKKLVIIKNGDHSLSSPENLKLLKKEIKLII